LLWLLVLLRSFESRRKMFAIPRVERAQGVDESLGIGRINFDQRIEIESRDRRPAQDSRDAADDDVLDAMLIEAF
jgi:hypothetical protein